MNRPKRRARPGEPKRAAQASEWKVEQRTPAARTFEHRFPSGNRATVRIGLSNPWGTNCEWDWLPISESDIPAYIAWRKMIGSEMADECGIGNICALDFSDYSLL